MNIRPDPMLKTNIYEVFQLEEGRLLRTEPKSESCEDLEESAGKIQNVFFYVVVSFHE